MTDDHNLYQDIGALKADSAAGKNQRALLFTKVEDLGREMNRQNQELRNLLGDHNNQVTEKLNEILAIKGQVDRHETDIAGLKTFKTRSLIGLAAIFGGGGVAGAYLDKLKDFFNIN